MSKKIIIGVALVILAGFGFAAFMVWRENSYSSKPLSLEEVVRQRAKIAALTGETNAPVPATLLPLKLSQPVRLAIGGLGQDDDEKNRQLGDLITVGLTGAQGFDLVERAALPAILQELNLSWSGLVRAKDAVRVGKLLKVDWFLLGTEAKINGADAIVARVVDARTGIIRDAGVFPADRPPPQLAEDLAAFLRQVRANAANAKIHVSLAIGAFEDLSVNNRRADFPSQLRGYLTAAYHDGDVTLLERDSVETLQREINLDLAGLTGDGGQNSPAVMPSAFWLVTGQYQSYETANLEIELNLDVRRIFGGTKHIALRGRAGEPLYRQARQEIDAAMHQSPEILVPTRVSEIRAQMALGKELAKIEWFNLTYPDNYQRLDEQEAARRRRNAEEAVRAFETVLLLDPGNREAKVYLAACLRKQTVGRIDEAREYYRELLDEPVQDKWAGQAQEALKIALMESGGTVAWLHAALAKSTNPAALEFYGQQLKAAETEITIRSGDGPAARELAEARLFEFIADNFKLMEGGTGRGGGNYGMDEFVETFGTNRHAAGLRLAELYPKMKAEFPKLAPQLLEFVLTYQTDTNSPLLAATEQSLDWQIAHPDEVYISKHLTLESSLFQWSMEKGLYNLAVKVMDRKRKLEGGLNIRQLDDQSKIAFGYAYLGAERYQDALEIFESYSNRPVLMASDGPWGPGWTAALTSRRSNYCRKKLGLPVTRNPHEFDLGKPLMDLDSPSTFSTDETGLWIGVAGRLLKLNFDLTTNLTIDLPLPATSPIVTLCVSGTKVWVGTDGDGLLEIDKNDHAVRRFTVADGLMMNRVACLSLAEDTLWIGYGSTPELMGFDSQMSQNGGIGKMDLNSHRFISFTPSIRSRPDGEELNADNLRPEAAGNPTRHAVQSLIASEDKTVWFNALGQPLRCYRSEQNRWESVPAIDGGSLALDTEHLFVGEPWGLSNASRINQAGPLGIHVLNIKENHWHDIGTMDGLPCAAVSTLTSHDGQLWVGGVGYIARLDTAQDKVLNFSYVPGSGVNRIQIAGGYVWAHSDCYLYRAPLSALQ